MKSLVESTVTVEKNVTIEPFAVVKGNSVLHDGCVVESFSYLVNADVGENTVVKASRVTDSVIGANCTVGPNAHVRQNSAIGNCCRIGNYVEVKNSRLGNGVKASHLAYVGDAEIGDGTNVGCGVIFVNYDGTCKHRSKVGKGCFVGCNSCLVAPVEIGDGCYVACGTVVERNVPKDSFCIGRSRMIIKEGKGRKYAKPDGEK